MSSAFSFPENCKIVEAMKPAVGAGATITSDYISLKNAHKLWFVISYTDGNGNAITYQPIKATAVAPTGNTSITNVVKWWSNLDTATSDLLVERTAATSYASDNAVKNKIIICEIDPADLGATYDVVAISAATPAAGEYISAIAVIQPRYASAVVASPTAITD
jgi:hypothetical protein